MPKGEHQATPPDYTWPGFEQLPEALKQCHRRFFQELSQRNPLTLREYRRAFRTFYLFMQVKGLEKLSDLTPQQLTAFQHWCYRRYHWTPGNMTGLLRTLRRIGNFLKRFGLLQQNLFEWATLAQPQQGGVESAQPLSWFRAARGYFSWLKARGVTYTARKNYLRFLRRFYRFLAEDGATHPAQITPEKIERLKAYLSVHLEENQQPLTPGAQRDTRRRAAKFYSWLVREGFIRSESASPAASEDPEDSQSPSRLRRVIYEFLAYVWMRYASETQQQYARSMRRFQEWITARPKRQKVRDMDQLTLEVITSYQRWINAEATRHNGASLSQPEKESRLYPLKAFLGFCYRKGFLKEDLRRFVMVPRRQYGLPNPLLTEEEMARLLETPNESTTIGIRDRAMLELSYSGLRAGELLNLKLIEVDVEENRAFIRQAKGDKERMVPMTSAALYWLSRWVGRRKEFLKKKDHATLFVSKEGRSIGRRHFAKMLERYVKRAQLPSRVSPHDLRRITATHLVANGAPIRYVQALLGHESLNVTTKYLRLTHAQIKKEYDQTHPSNRRTRHAAASA